MRTTRVRSVLFLLTLSLSLAPAIAAQNQASCAFEDGKGLRVQYTASADEPRNGKVWTPGGKPMSVFTDTDLNIGGNTLPIGAFGLFLIPGDKSWTLIVSKGVRGAAEYDYTQDLARTTLEVGDLGHSTGNTKLVLARKGPKQCNLRIYAGHWMAWGELHEK